MQAFFHKVSTAFSLSILIILQSTCIKTNECCPSIVDDTACCISTTNNCFNNKSLWLATPYSVKINPHELLQSYKQLDSENVRFLSTFTYDSTFNGSSNGYLGSMPFWVGKNSIVFGNSGVADPTGYDTANTPIEALPAEIDGYQFGLGNLTELHTISINIGMQRFAADFRFNYQQLFNGNKGYYFNIELPIVATRMSYCINEPSFPETTEVQDDQFITYPTEKIRYQNFTQAFNVGTSNPSQINGHHNRVISLEYGRIANGHLTSIRPGDLMFSAGFTYQEMIENRGFNIGFKACCPTGTIPNARYMIEPVNGRGGYWGVGFITQGYQEIWSSYEEEHNITLLAQFECLHLAPTKNPLMTRSFDLNQNGPGSRYLLVQEYLPENSGSYTANGITQAINITTFPVISKFDYDLSGSLAASCFIKEWNIDFGARFWARAKECLNINYTAALQTENHYNLNDYAVLGRQINYNADTTTTLNLCEPLARINSSNIRVKALPVPANLQDYVKDATVSANRIPSNIYQALNIADAALPAQSSIGFFANVGYGWQKDDHRSKLSILADFTFGNEKVKTWMIGAQYNLSF